MCLYLNENLYYYISLNLYHHLYICHIYAHICIYLCLYLSMKKESVRNILRIFFYLSSNSQIFYAIYILVTPPKTLFFLLRSPPWKTDMFGPCHQGSHNLWIPFGFHQWGNSPLNLKEERTWSRDIYSFAQYINFFQVLVTCVFLHGLMARNGNSLSLLDTFSLVLFFILH